LGSGRWDSEILMMIRQYFSIYACRKHFYIGSANIGSRGASWTKELGVLVTNCPALGEDASKLIQLYWDIYAMDQLPSK